MLFLRYCSVRFFWRNTNEKWEESVNKNIIFFQITFFFIIVNDIVINTYVSGIQNCVNTNRKVSYLLYNIYCNGNISILIKLQMKGYFFIIIQMPLMCKNGLKNSFLRSYFLLIFYKLNLHLWNWKSNHTSIIFLLRLSTCI